MEKISFCIPCYNSARTIAGVLQEIHSIMAGHEKEYDYEIVCAVDGSPDDVGSVLAHLAASDPRLKTLILSKNFGQANARMASLEYADGDYFVCLDDDGQCPLDKFWELFEPLKTGRDVSVANYPQQQQSWWKNLGSSFNNYMVHQLLDVPPQFRMTNFFAFKAFIRDQILTYKNPYPYITGLLTQATNRFALVPMEERPRKIGKTGYTFAKLVKHWLDGFTSFSVKPLRMASIIGMLFALFGFILGALVIIRKLFFSDILMGYTSIFAGLMFIGGIVMCLLGIIGEYIGRIYLCLNRMPQYVVREKINLDKKNE